MRMCLTSNCIETVGKICFVNESFIREQQWLSIHPLHKITPNEIYSFWFEMLWLIFFLLSFSMIHMPCMSIPKHLWVDVSQTEKKRLTLTSARDSWDWWFDEKKSCCRKIKINFPPTYNQRGSSATYDIAWIRLNLFSSRKSLAFKTFINSTYIV